MKRITFLFLITLFAFACSSDDDNGGSNTTDPIVGKWFWGKEVYVLEDGTEIEVEDPIECQNMTYNTFNSDNTIGLVSVEFVNGECIETDVSFEYANWSKLSNGNYSFVSKLPNESEEISEETIEFLENNTVFRYVKHNTGIYDGQNIVTEYEYRNKE